MDSLVQLAADPTAWVALATLVTIGLGRIARRDERAAEFDAAKRQANEWMAAHPVIEVPR